MSDATSVGEVTSRALYGDVLEYHTAVIPSQVFDGQTNGDRWELGSDGANEVSGDFIFDVGLSLRLQL